jgi:hypothetical protein
MYRAIVCATLLLIVVPAWCAEASGEQQKNRKKQNNAQQAAQGAQAGQQSRLGRTNSSNQSPTVQMAQRMIASFDQDGDAALNLIELQTGLTALFERMSQERMQAAMAAGAAFNQTGLNHASTSSSQRGPNARGGNTSGLRAGQRGR